MSYTPFKCIFPCLSLLFNYYWTSCHKRSKIECTFLPTALAKDSGTETHIVNEVIGTERHKQNKMTDRAICS